MNSRWTLRRNKLHNRTPKSPNQFATIAIREVTIGISAVNSNEKKTKPEITPIVPTVTKIMVVVKQTLTPTIKFPTITTQAIQIFKKTEDLDLSTQPVRPAVKLATPQRIDTLEQPQQTDRLPGIGDLKERKQRPTGKSLKQLRWECSSCSPNFKLETPRLHSGAACNRPQTIEITKLPPIPEVVWQQPAETSTTKCNSKDTQKVFPDLCLLFQVSCVSTWTQLSKLTNVLNTRTTLELQPIMLRTRNIRAVFTCNRQAGLKLTIEKRHFGVNLNS